MPACEYCSSSFEDDAAYAEHLQSAHADELGRIDRRRIDQYRTDDGARFGQWGYVALGIGLLAVVIVVAFVVFSGGQAAAGLPSHGDQSLLENLTRHASEGRDHVAQGTNVQYDTNPPTSGPHYPNPATAGFYSDSLAAGNLVHSLEHGAVVIYYDPSAVTADARENLKTLADAHTGRWKSVIAVPNPTGNPESPYVLTAWRTTLRQSHYDASTVRAFLAEYLGRGPEHPVG